MRLSNWHCWLWLSGVIVEELVQLRASRPVFLAYDFQALPKSHPAVIDVGLASSFRSITHREDEGKLPNVASL